MVTVLHVDFAKFMLRGTELGTWNNRIQEYQRQIQIYRKSFGKQIGLLISKKRPCFFFENTDTSSLLPNGRKISPRQIKFKNKFKKNYKIIWETLHNKPDASSNPTALNALRVQRFCERLTGAECKEPWDRRRRWKTMLARTTADILILFSRPSTNSQGRNKRLPLIFVWPCTIDTNNIDNQLDATIMFINNSNHLKMFRAMISPIFRALTRLCLQLVV
jgi:hypothetical protein